MRTSVKPFFSLRQREICDADCRPIALRVIRFELRAEYKFLIISAVFLSMVIISSRSHRTVITLSAGILSAGCAIQASADARGAALVGIAPFEHNTRLCIARRPAGTSVLPGNSVESCLAEQIIVRNIACAYRRTCRSRCRHGRHSNLIRRKHSSFCVLVCIINIPKSERGITT